MTLLEHLSEHNISENGFVDMDYDKVVDTSGEIIKDMFADDEVSKEYITDFLRDNEASFDRDSFDILQEHLSSRANEMDAQEKIETETEPVEEISKYEKNYEYHKEWLIENKDSFRMPNDTFQAYHKMGELYNAYKENIEIDGKVPSKGDVAMATINFMNSNLPETLVMSIFRYAFSQDEKNDVDVEEKDDINDEVDFTDPENIEAAFVDSDTEYSQQNDEAISESDLNTIGVDSEAEKSDLIPDDDIESPTSDTFIDFSEFVQSQPESDTSLVNAKEAATRDVFCDEDDVETISKCISGIFEAYNKDDEESEDSDFTQSDEYEEKIDALKDAVDDIPFESMEQMVETVANAYVNAFLDNAKDTDNTEMGKIGIEAITEVLGEFASAEVSERISDLIQEPNIDINIQSEIETSLEGVLYVESAPSQVIEVDNMAIVDGELVDATSGEDVGTFQADTDADDAVDRTNVAVDEYMKDVELNGLYDIDLDNPDSEPIELEVKIEDESDISIDTDDLYTANDNSVAADLSDNAEHPDINQTDSNDTIDAEPSEDPLYFIESDSNSDELIELENTDSELPQNYTDDYENFVDYDIDTAGVE